MNFDEALAAIEDLDGTGSELGVTAPTSQDFPLDEYQRRYARLTSLMDREGFDALVFTQEEPIRYLTGYNSVVWAVSRWLPSVFVATRDPCQALLVGSVFDAGCADGTAWVPTTSYQRTEELPDIALEHLRSIGATGARVGFEIGTASAMAMPQHLVARLLSAGSDIPRDATPLFHAVRMLKSPREVGRIRTSVQAAVAGYRAGLEAAVVGMTEKELVAIISSTMYLSGSTAGTRPLFVNCVSGRERYALVDTPASDRAMRDGDIVFVDGGGACDGYVSDILRLIGVGTLRAEDRRYAEVAADATQAMVQAARPGIRVSELMSAASESVASTGLPETIGAVAGHGIGLELWERPLIRHHDDPDEDVTLRQGMVLCLEPILAPPHPDGGLAGIFVIEQQVVITDTGCEVLSAELPGQLWEVGA